MAVMMLVLDLGTQPVRMDRIVDQPTPSLAQYLPDEVALVGMTQLIEEVPVIIIKHRVMIMHTTPKTYDLDLIREIVKLVLTFQSFGEIL